MREHRFSQVDVFSAEPFRGNPVAVVHDTQDVDDAAAPAIASWTNLSETAFLLPPTSPEADYRVRIRTPTTELPFAGHPTLGAARAWLDAGGRPAGDDVLVQECPAGLVRVRIDGDRLAFAAPPLVRSGPVPTDLAERAANALGLSPSDVRDARWADNGPGWLALLLTDADTVLRARVDPQVLGDLKVGVVGPHPAGGPADVEVRAFAPAYGVGEDPVTGSLNAALAPWLCGAGVVGDVYVAAQGTALNRVGRVHVEFDGVTTWVGGASRTLVSGTIRL